MMFDIVLATYLRTKPVIPTGRKRVDYPDISFSISADNITLRQALNQIAESSGTKFWCLRTVAILGSSSGPMQGSIDQRQPDNRS